jgi:hypothetical protein
METLTRLIEEVTMDLLIVIMKAAADMKKSAGERTMVSRDCSPVLVC